MSDLLAVLERAEIGSGELDAMMHWHYCEPPESREERTLWWVTMQFTAFPALRIDDWRKPYTTSLDAIVSLIERELPGWAPNVGRNIHHGYWHGEVQKADEENGNLHIGASAPTGALALCIAFVKAKEAAKQNDGRADQSKDG